MMEAKARAALKPTMRRYDRLKLQWDRRLRSLGGDPSGLVLENFRPLRLSREEDWSDWLAWLLEASTTGFFAKALFSSYMDRGTEFASPKVKREEPTETLERRADIVVEWRSGETTDIEVKVEDEQFEKAFATAKQVKARRPESKCHHFILLSDKLLPAWNAVAGDRVHEEEINVILWRDISQGLRQCLWKGQESLVWRAWAWTFCGAVEQRLLGLSEPDSLRGCPSKLQMALSWLDILNSSQERMHAE